MAKQNASDRSIEIGRQVARWVFERRGNHTEAHISEAELTSIIAMGALKALMEQ